MNAFASAECRVLSTEWPAQHSALGTRHYISALWWVLLSILLTACSSKELPTYQEQGYVFGTLVEVSIYGEEEPRARKAVAQVMQEFQRLHNLLHAWKPSELSELNAAFARGEAKAAPAEVSDMLKDAAQISAQSDGLFNPAIGGLIKLWGFQSDEFKPILPDEKRLAALVAAKPQMSDLVFSEKTNPSRPPLVRGGDAASSPDKGRIEEGLVLMSSRNPAVQLDLGGYAKGYALDRAAALLKQGGIRNALINIGGNVMAVGAHGERAWRVGIQHPRKPSPIAVLDLHDGEAIGTSGDYQRYFEVDGKRYCHLIDPRSGRPVQGVQAVTVLTRGAHAGALSDAVSKPLFISGSAGWRDAAKKMQLTEALLIDDAGVVHLTAAMQKRLEFSDKATVVKVE